MTGPAILAIDLGTSACKVVLYEGGHVVAAGSAPLTTHHGGDGVAEQDPRAWWETLTQLVPRIAGPAADRVAAIGVTAQSDSLIVADDEGRAVRPCILWMDTRGGAELDALRDRFSDDTIRTTTGLRPALSFTAAKLAWVRAHEPDTLADGHRFLQPKDLIVRWLTAEWVTDPSSASRSMMLDRWSGTWWPGMLRALDVGEAALPAIRPAGAVAGRLGADPARTLGLRSGTPVAVGAADRAAEALACGLGAGEAMVSSGTATGIVMAIPASERIADEAILVPMHAVPGQAMALMSVAPSGAALGWLLRMLGDDDERSVLMAEAAAARPGAGGVTFLPFLMGAKSVRWSAAAHGLIAGLDLSVGRGDLVRAAIEGVAYETDACLRRLSGAWAPIDRLVLVGGGQRDELATSILVDVAGIRALALDEPHAAAAGAMLLAGQAVGLWSDPLAVAAERRRGRVIEPVGPSHAAYRERSAAYERLCEAIGLPAVGSSPIGGSHPGSGGQRRG